MDGVVLLESALQHLHGQSVLNIALHGPLQGPGAEGGIISDIDQEIARFLRQLDVELLLRQPFAQQGELDIDNLGQIILGQAVEDDGLVDPV